MGTRTAPQHGERRCYLRGCRRRECTDANKRYCKQYRVTRFTTGRRRIDAGDYAAIVRRYTEAGWSHSELSELTGCSETVFHDLLDGAPRINQTSAARIDAIPAVPQREGGGAYTDATGTRRRGQALHRYGRSVNALAAALGLAPDHVSRILHARSKHVRSGTATAMQALYERWKTEAGPSEDSKQRAARFGWRDPQWWEDMGGIDDPRFDPDKADAELGRRELAALRREEVAHLDRFGTPTHEIAARLGLAESTVHAIVAELRTGQRRDRRKETAA